MSLFNYLFIKRTIRYFPIEIMSNLLEIKMFTYAFYCTTAKNTTYDDVRWFIVASSKLYTVIFFYLFRFVLFYVYIS